MAKSKLVEWSEAEAKKDKAWAKKVSKDKKWLKNASSMSLDMMHQRINTPLPQLAKQKRDYLTYRACAMQGPGRFAQPIAPDMRRKYKKITGHYPKCGRK